MNTLGNIYQKYVFFIIYAHLFTQKMHTFPPRVVSFFTCFHFFIIFCYPLATEKKDEPKKKPSPSVLIIFFFHFAAPRRLFFQVFLFLIVFHLRTLASFF